MAAAVEANAENPESWSDLLTDVVTKCGRDSERRLFLYGISSDRCFKCQTRLESGDDECRSCCYRHQKLRECTRCSQKNDPVMWCVECDAYFCATCHKKPHVLMLGSAAPHHCFPIDGASGKHFVEAAWSEKFTAVMEATFRLRLHDKIQAEELPVTVQTQATGQQVLGGSGAGDCAGTTMKVSKQLPHSVDASSVALAAVNGTSVDPLPSSTSVPPTTTDEQTLSSSRSDTTQQQSRKRGLAESGDLREKLQNVVCADSLGGQAPPTLTSIPAPAPAPKGVMLVQDSVKELRGEQAAATKHSGQQALSPKMSMDQLLSQNVFQKRQRHHQKERELQESDRALHPQQEQHRSQERKQVGASKHELQCSNLKRSGCLKDQQQQVDQRRQKGVQQHLNEQRQQGKQTREEEQGRQEERRHKEEQWRQEQLRWQELRERDTLGQQGEYERDTLRHQGQFREQGRQQQLLLEERLRNEQQRSSLQRDEARSPMCQSNQFVSQAQHVRLGRPESDFMASSSVSASTPGASVTPSNVSAPTPPTTRLTFASSPADVAHATPRFGPAAPSPCSYPFQSNAGDPVASATPCMGYDNAHQEHVSAFETTSQDHGGDRHLIIRDPSVQPQQTGYPGAMVPHRIGAGAMGDFGLSKLGEDDELRAIWVSDYDSVNVLVMQLDSEIAKRAEEGHAFVHMSNNITVPEQLKQAINNLRAQRDAAMKKRFESVVRVCIFSDSVRSFAQQNEYSNIWSDVPEVLKASHNKCAEVSATIRELELQAQELREGVDEAVSSGDPVQMQNVARLGALLADCERKIRTSSGERDKQFNFMFQFSRTLRNMVRAEWATAGGGYHDTR
uniref:B box-type domain-containing protein n=1 Tax=Peronospora matthiolae TaxID=2874970 RepID=A0AAV1V4G7_9STRA